MRIQFVAEPGVGAAFTPCAGQRLHVRRTILVSMNTSAAEGLQACYLIRNLPPGLSFRPQAKIDIRIKRGGTCAEVFKSYTLAAAVTQWQHRTTRNEDNVQ